VRWYIRYGHFYDHDFTIIPRQSNYSTSFDVAHPCTYLFMLIYYCVHFFRHICFFILIIQAKRILHDPAGHDKLAHVYRTIIIIIIRLAFDEVNDSNLQLEHEQIGAKSMKQFINGVGCRL